MGSAGGSSHTTSLKPFPFTLPITPSPEWSSSAERQSEAGRNSPLQSPASTAQDPRFPRSADAMTDDDWVKTKRLLPSARKP